MIIEILTIINNSITCCTMLTLIHIIIHVGYFMECGTLRFGLDNILNIWTSSYKVWIEQV
jgi:hypothetical protein